MTPEAQRIAIAEACGWKRREQANPPTRKTITEYGRTVMKPETGEVWDTGDYMMPDYLSDLNAMHEAEKKFMGMEGNIPHPMEAVYYHHLREIVDRFPGTLVYHATAAQRAEAFLRTLNLWRE